ncbi:MAG: hypothetical protein OIF58_11555 [Cohaesibacter sp.]|nr:hypothetical protein [Cohaesibacter sp.]
MEEAQAVDLAEAEKEQSSAIEADVAQEAKETAEAGRHITDTSCPLVHRLNQVNGRHQQQKGQQERALPRVLQKEKERAVHV